MIAYRICNSIFSDDISGTGARMTGGRWNSKGTRMLYLTEAISLAVLEMLVHNQFKDFEIPLSLLNVSVPETAEIKELKLNKLKANWMRDIEYTKFIGDEFIRNGKNPIMKVPSAIITEEHNFLVNPLHPDFKKIKITEARIFETDERLFTI